MSFRTLIQTSTEFCNFIKKEKDDAKRVRTEEEKKEVKIKGTQKLCGKKTVEMI